MLIAGNWPARADQGLPIDGDFFCELAASRLRGVPERRSGTSDRRYPNAGIEPHSVCRDPVVEAST